MVVLNAGRTLALALAVALFLRPGQAFFRFRGAHAAPVAPSVPSDASMWALDDSTTVDEMWDNITESWENQSASSEDVLAKLRTLRDVRAVVLSRIGTLLSAIPAGTYAVPIDSSWIAEPSWKRTPCLR